MEADDDDHFERTSRFQKAKKKFKLIGAVVAVAIIVTGVALGVVFAKRQRDDLNGGNNSDSNRPALGSLATPSPNPGAFATSLPGKPSPSVSADCTYLADGKTLDLDSTIPRWTGSSGVWSESSSKLNMAGVQFMASNTNESYVANPEDNPPREYFFKVSVAGNYFLTMISSVKGPSSFNTLWLQFPYGSGLKYWSIDTGLPETIEKRTGWQVVYQNEGELVVGIFGVKSSRHTISLAEALVPGEQYRILVSGRSAQFTLYRILLTLCQSTECNGSGATWNAIKAATSSGYVTRCM
jgi:hypothetical protein